MKGGLTDITPRGWPPTSTPWRRRRAGRPVPVVPGRNGIPGQYLERWSRDFFTIAAS